MGELFWTRIGVLVYGVILIVAYLIFRYFSIKKIKRDNPTLSDFGVKEYYLDKDYPMNFGFWVFVVSIIGLFLYGTFTQ